MDRIAWRLGAQAQGRGQEAAVLVAGGQGKGHAGTICEGEPAAPDLLD